MTLRTTQPLFCDPYRRNRLTGGLILIDEATSATVGAGMITEAPLTRRGGHWGGHGGDRRDSLP